MTVHLNLTLTFNAFKNIFLKLKLYNNITISGQAMYCIDIEVDLWEKAFKIVLFKQY